VFHTAASLVEKSCLGSNQHMARVERRVGVTDWNGELCSEL